MGNMNDEELTVDFLCEYHENLLMTLEEKVNDLANIELFLSERITNKGLEDFITKNIWLENALEDHPKKNNLTKFYRFGSGRNTLQRPMRKRQSKNDFQNKYFCHACIYHSYL